MLQNTYFELFSCKNRIRYSRERALSSLPDRGADASVYRRQAGSGIQTAGPPGQPPLAPQFKFPIPMNLGIGIFTRPNSQIPVQIPNSQRLVLGCIEAKFA